MKNFYLGLSDNRISYVASLLKQKNVKVFDFESNIKDISQNDVCLLSPAYKWDKSILEQLPNNLTIIGGNFDKSFDSIMQRFNYINIMENEDFVLKNANLTAEGFLADFISNTKKSIFELNTLILGSGRVARAVQNLFFKLGISFDVAMRSEKELNLSKLISHNSLPWATFKDNLNSYDVVINTIPVENIFDKQDNFKQGCVVFELASKKCLNQDLFSNIKFVFCPALPSKYCEQSAGELIYQQLSAFIS